MASSPRIEELRKKFEENPRRYFAPLANEYRKAGDLQQAIAICREYLPQQPGHMSGHIVFGQALYEARSFDEARTVFETALSLDPENLIALRHLGDIALITGDSENAKVWYKRVLEADPRNEEIQAQLTMIDQASASAPTPAITPAIPQAPAAAAPPPSSAAPTVVMKAVPRPGTPVTATSPTAEINVDAVVPTPAAASPVEPTLEVPAMSPLAEPAEPAPALIEGLESTSANTGAQHETPISSFSLDGLETTSLSADAASAPPAPAPLADLDFGPAGSPAPPPAVDQTASPVDLDFLEPAAPDATPVPASDLEFTPPTPAPVAGATAPDMAAAEPALDLDLGSLGTSAPPTPPVPPAAADAPAHSGGEEAPLDLEISLPGAAPAEAPALGGWASPERRPEATPEPGVAIPEATEAPGAPPPTGAPFMTETMAELYLQQGHREQALQVYRALAQQRPADAALRGKIARIEAELAPAVPASGAGVAGPTIRDLLVAIAERRPGYRPAFPTSNGATSSVHEAAPEAAAEMPVARPEALAEPGDAGREDVLGATLGFRAVASPDETAAQLLARAFSSNGGGAAPLVGEPARPAADELSLRSVFKATEPAPPPSSFSFDQFFSQRASAEHPVVAAPDGRDAESPEEVARFTQWLEGLKKR